MQYPPSPGIARVVPLTRTRAVKGLFDYLIPEDLAAEVEVGSLLRVRFAGRTVLAVVADLAAESELAPERLATVDALLPSKLPAELVSLSLWMAAEYCSTPARALASMLPPGAAQGMGEKQVLVAALAPLGHAALDSVSGVRLTPAQRTLLETLRRDGETTAAALGTPALRRLESRGLVTLRHATSARAPRRHEVSTALAVPPALGAAQAASLEILLPRLQAGEGGEFLLHGVTGSGKTEVFLRAAEAALAAGRTVLILVPEIGLTPQALARFEARFGDVVAVLHSGMAEGARHDEWLRLARGQARVCVGPRSAVFAPLENIGLIVVDEEHERSYKHEGDPRYDARAVAEHRANAHGALLLAGSATPRPESVERMRRLRLPTRIDGRPLPAVETLDMRGRHHPLHPDTHLALADCKHAGGKAIVLLNRRGWSNFLSCGSCGRVWMCPNCDVALVLHRASGTVACHHCGHRERVPERCPDCGSVSVSRHGAGTERLEHELMTTLADPDFPVMRLDADSSGVEARARTLEAFHSARAGVLVGTQMIAKGHDFADVGLGVVLDADQTLRFPDFRAEERTFALLTQLTGRVGRGGRDHGRVLVQTLAPQARPIVLAAAHDSDTFLTGELERRRALAYPPFSTLIRLVCSAVEADAAHHTAAALRERIEPPDASVLGPAPLFMLRGRARAQLVVKARWREAAIAAVAAAVDAIAATKDHRSVAISVDVDPQ